MHSILQIQSVPVYPTAAVSDGKFSITGGNTPIIIPFNWERSVPPYYTYFLPFPFTNFRVRKNPRTPLIFRDSVRLLFSKEGFDAIQ